MFLGGFCGQKPALCNSAGRFTTNTVFFSRMLLQEANIYYGVSSPFHLCHMLSLVKEVKSQFSLIEQTDIPEVPTMMVKCSFNFLRSV